MGHAPLMSLAQEKNSEPYIGKGPGGEYAIPFRYDDASWLHVTLVNADGTTTEVLPAQYTLSPTGGPQGTATLTTSVAAKDTTRLIISRRAPAKQTLSLTSNSPLPAKDLEKALDQLAMAIMDRDSSGGAAASKALTFPIGEPPGNATRLPMPERRKGLFIGFNDTTGAMEARPLSVALHTTINEAKTAISQTLTVITQGVTTINNAKTATLAVLENALAVGTDLLASIPRFFKTGESGAIKLGEVNGNEAGSNAINLQSHRTNVWQVASGARSIAIGSSEASGDDSVALGNGCVALGSHTTSVGHGNQATFPTGSAFGYGNVITGHNSVALGAGNSAESYWSVSVGLGNHATGQQSSAFGYRSSAAGWAGTAMGYGNNTDYELGTAVGAQNFASGSRSSAFGYSNAATSDRSTSLGYTNQATGQDATAVGNHNIASNHVTVALGLGNMVSGFYSAASGISNTVTGSESSATGLSNQVSNDRSAAFGRYNFVTAYDAGAVGFFNQVSAFHSVAFGYGTQVGTPFITEVGNIGSYGAARVRVDGSAGTVGLSFGYMTSAPAYPWGYSQGNEPSGTLGQNMLSFRSDGYQLHIDVAVAGSVRTVTLPLS